MRSPKTMIAVLAVSTLGLSSVAFAKPAETDSDTGNQQVTDSAGDAGQRRSERRQSAKGERQSERRENRRNGDNNSADNGSTNIRRTDGNRPRADGSDTEDSHANNRRTERRRPVDRRLSNQRARTRAGLKNGDVTHRELKRIRRDRHNIARMDRRFGSDGRYTKRERRKLNRALDRAGNRVYRAKNNRRVAANSNSRRYHRHEAEPHAYSEPDESYVTASASSTTISARADGFSVSWSTSHQE